MQARWFCGGCQREWAWANGWAPGEPCLLCGSVEVRQVVYQPAFEGADLPRETLTPVTAAPAAAPVAAHDNLLLQMTGG